MKTWNFDISNKSSQSIQSEPDFRNEFDILMSGSGTEISRGHWVIYRQSDTSKHSQYWNHERQESIGGPPFEYKDYLIQARYRSFLTGQEEYRDLMGMLDRPTRVYYINHVLTPKKEDYILEIENPEGPEVPTQFNVLHIYDILVADKPRDENGRVEYCVCICKREKPRGDKTLENIRISEIL